MSGFRTHLGRRLGEKGLVVVGDWDRLTQEPDVRGALRRIEGIGGDPDFCLFLLAEYRWRRVRPIGDPRKRERLLKALSELLGAKGEWGRLVHAQAGRWEALQALRETLLGGTAIDEGLTWTTTTGSLPKQASPLSEHQSICLSLLDRHLKHSAPGRSSKRTLLVDLLQPFGMVPIESQDPERWVEKRLARCHGELRLPLGTYYRDYHAEHERAGLPCTRACELMRQFSTGSQLSVAKEKAVLLGRPVPLLWPPRGKARLRGRARRDRRPK